MTITKEQSLKEAYLYCHVLTKREARNFYFAFLTLPKQQRFSIYAVYAFARIADDIADGENSTDQKKFLLNQLRLDLQSAISGHASGLVLLALADVIANFNIDSKLFDQLIDGVEMDLVEKRYRTFDDLCVYCYHVASVIGLISIEIFGYRDERAKQAAKDLGIAMQITNILRDLQEDMLTGRVYLPLEDLEFYEYSEIELANSITNKNFYELMRFETSRARRFYDSGSELFQYIDPRSRACVSVLHGLYLRLLNRLENRNFQVFGEKIKLSSREKIMVMIKLWITSFLIKYR